MGGVDRFDAAAVHQLHRIRPTFVPGMRDPEVLTPVAEGLERSVRSDAEQTPELQAFCSHIPPPRSEELKDVMSAPGKVGADAKDPSPNNRIGRRGSGGVRKRRSFTGKRCDPAAWRS